MLFYISLGVAYAIFHLQWRAISLVSGRPNNKVWILEATTFLHTLLYFVYLMHHVIYCHNQFGKKCSMYTKANNLYFLLLAANLHASLKLKTYKSREQSYKWQMRNAMFKLFQSFLNQFPFFIHSFLSKTTRIKQVNITACVFFLKPNPHLTIRSKCHWQCDFCSSKKSLNASITNAHVCICVGVCMQASCLRLSACVFAWLWGILL